MFCIVFSTSGYKSLQRGEPSRLAPLRRNYIFTLLTMKNFYFPKIPCFFIVC